MFVCRVPRSKRDIEKEGSGEDDYENYYDDEDDDTVKYVFLFVFFYLANFEYKIICDIHFCFSLCFAIQRLTTPKPTKSDKAEEHAHRHHHGDDKVRETVYL